MGKFFAHVFGDTYFLSAKIFKKIVHYVNGTLNPEGRNLPKNATNLKYQQIWGVTFCLQISLINRSIAANAHCYSIPRKVKSSQKCEQVKVVGFQNQILAERNYIVSAYKCPRVLGLR